MAKQYTWNSKLVERAVGRVRAEAFRFAAVNIRRTAMRSMKKGTKSQYTSKPGEPPRKHSSALQKSIYFALDETTMSTVIGPVKFKGQSQGAKALESGGTVIKTETRFITPRQTRSGNRPYKPMSGRSAAEQKHIKAYYDNKKPVKKKVKINIKPRPFMVPALQKEIKNMAKNLQRARNKFKKS